MREPHHPPREELELPSVLHALSDPARLEIVRRLAAGSEEWSCGRFELGLSKATLSHHFRVLREAGVVRTRPDGRKRLLSLREEDLNARFPGLLAGGAGRRARRSRFRRCWPRPARAWRRRPALGARPVAPARP